MLRRVYEDFHTQIASAKGKNSGQFDTPSCVIPFLLLITRGLVERLAPYKKGQVYDPCCGSVGMFMQSEKASRGATVLGLIRIGNPAFNSRCELVKPLENAWLFVEDGAALTLKRLALP